MIAIDLVCMTGLPVGVARNPTILIGIMCYVSATINWKMRPRCNQGLISRCFHRNEVQEAIMLSTRQNTWSGRRSSWLNLSTLFRPPLPFANHWGRACQVHLGMAPTKWLIAFVMELARLRPQDLGETLS